MEVFNETNHKSVPYPHNTGDIEKVTGSRSAGDSYRNLVNSIVSKVLYKSFQVILIIINHN